MFYCDAEPEYLKLPLNLIKTNVIKVQCKSVYAIWPTVFVAMEMENLCK